MLIDIQEEILTSLQSLNGATENHVLLPIERKPLRFINLKQQPTFVHTNAQKSNYIYQSKNASVNMNRNKTNSCLTSYEIRLGFNLIIVNLCDINVNLFNKNLNDTLSSLRSVSSLSNIKVSESSINQIITAPEDITSYLPNHPKPYNITIIGIDLSFITANDSSCRTESECVSNLFKPYQKPYTYANPYCVHPLLPNYNT